MSAIRRLPTPRPLTIKTPRLQRGVTLIVGLIMLVMITLLVAGAFTLSSSNLKSVGNMQVREEAVAAANLAVEQVISSPFTDAPVDQEINVDIDKNGSTDYTVTVLAPRCIKALSAIAPKKCQIDPLLLCTSGWNTEWDIDAQVTDAASGGAVRVRQGVRVLLSDTEKNLVCP